MGTTLTRGRRAPPGGGTDPVPAPKRSWSHRFSMAHGLAVLAGLLAFVLVAAATKNSDTTIGVVVARTDLAAGVLLSPGDVDVVEVAAGSPVVDGLLTEELFAAGGLSTVRAVRAGEPLTRQAVVASSTVGAGAGTATGAARSMSIPVEREQAVAGALRVGDVVDVIHVLDGTARYIVEGVQVIDVPRDTGSGGGLAGASRTEFFVVVEVTAEQALDVAVASSEGSVTVIRSTGTPA